MGVTSWELSSTKLLCSGVSQNSLVDIFEKSDSLPVHCLAQFFVF